MAAQNQPLPDRALIMPDARAFGALVSPVNCIGMSFSLLALPSACRKGYWYPGVRLPVTSSLSFAAFVQAEF
jgi:hypothetical protein